MSQTDQIPNKTGLEGRMIQRGDGQVGREGVLRGNQEAKAWGASRERAGKARTRWRERAAGTHRVQQNAILLVLLRVQHVVTVERGGQRSALEPILTAFPHLLPGPHHSWQNRIPTKPGSYVPSGSIATGLLSFLRLRGRATDRGKGRIAWLH